MAAKNGTLTVAAGTKEIDLHWTVKPNTPILSYESALTAYKAKYARQYRELTHGERKAKH